MSWLPLAHALAARQDLPVPAWLFAWGASIVLIASFFALAAAWRKPRFERQHWRALGAGFSRAAVSAPVQVVCGLVGVFLFGVGVYAGLRGTEAPDRNFALTFFFVTTWLGFPFFSALLGDVFRPFNPWRAVGRVAGGGFQKLPDSAPPTSPTPGGSVAGPPRSASSRSSGWRSSTAPAAASRSASTRTPAPSPRSSTAPTR